jgi:two-component system, cell cycle response regulator DivK
MSDKKKILIVEDNEKNLKLFKIVLRKIEADLITAKDGLDALDKIKSEKPDLLIMDIQIPEISGMDVLKQIKLIPELANIPAIAVTAYASENDKELILNAGFDDYISKPIEIKTFVAKISEFISNM